MTFKISYLKSVQPNRSSIHKKYSILAIEMHVNFSVSEYWRKKAADTVESFRHSWEASDSVGSLRQS